MDSLVLKVSPEDVKEKAQQISLQKSLMDSLMADMQNQVVKLQDYWKDDAGQNYAMKYQNVSKNVRGSLETLMKHVQNLNEVADKYTEVATEQSQKVQAMSSNDIFQV